MPSMRTIAKWWCSDDGQARIRQINDEHGINLGASLGSIDLDSARCWACDYAPSHGTDIYKQGVALQRCHIVPDSLGGSSDPSNLVIMCHKCHEDNPDTTDEFTFWWWFERAKTHQRKRVEAITDVLPSTITDEDGEAILGRFKDMLKSGKVALVSGKLSIGSIQAIVHQAARETQNKQG